MNTIVNNRPAAETATAIDTERKYRAPALEKGLDILELLARATAPMTISQIASALGRSVSELFRMVIALEHRGYITQASEGRDGYVRADPAYPAPVTEAMFKITDLVGEFEKPIYVSYDADICAHSRSGKIGCRNCIDA